MTSYIKNTSKSISEIEAMSWCINNNIKIYPIVVDKKYGYKNYVKIQIYKEGRTQTGNDLYKQDMGMTRKILELYKYMYEHS